MEFIYNLRFEKWDLNDLIPVSSVYLNPTEFCKLHLRHNTIASSIIFRFQ